MLNNELNDRTNRYQVNINPKTDCEAKLLVKTRHKTLKHLVATDGAQRKH